MSEADLDPIRERVTGTLRHLSPSGALPALPAVAGAALALLRDPTAGIEALSRIIRTDVGVSELVVRAAFPDGGVLPPARDVERAVMTIGRKKTCDMLVAVCARGLHGGASPHTGPLWQHALAVAVASEELARRMPGIDAGFAFVSGLFHDAGRIAFLLADEMSLEVVDRLVAGGEGERTELEREWYGFDHAEAGAVLAEGWGLPPEQCEAIRCHHDPERAVGARDLARLLNAADAVAYAIGHGASEVVPRHVPFARLDLSRAELREIGARVVEQLAWQRALLG